jgi:hypothetical protein
MNTDRLRAVVLLAPAALGIVTSIVSALVPRLRTVEVITIVAAAFGQRGDADRVAPAVSTVAHGVLSGAALSCDV